MSEVNICNDYACGSNRNGYCQLTACSKIKNVRVTTTETGIPVVYKDDTDDGASIMKCLRCPLKDTCVNSQVPECYKHNPLGKPTTSVVGVSKQFHSGEKNRL